MTPRITKARRLEAAGYVYRAGWLKAGQFAERVQAQVDAHREDVERIAAQAKPRGRPKTRDA